MGLLSGNMFSTADCEAALLVDASNAFNSINRKAAIHDITILSPALSTVLQYTYSAAAVRLLVTGEGEISSTEGTTQGDSLAMAIYRMRQNFRGGKLLRFSSQS